MQHPSERARDFRELVNTRESEGEMHGQVVTRLVSTLPPGSIEEAQAIEEIDQRRYLETNPLTRRQRHRKQRAYWSDRDHALDG